MNGSVIRFIFFGNYFVGLLAVALTAEASLQLRLPACSPAYYLLLFLAPVVYYTYAYIGKGTQVGTSNARTRWYQEHRHFVRSSQVALSVVCMALLLWLVGRNFSSIMTLPPDYWLSIGVLVLAAALYYGLLPAPAAWLNLRNTGWLKAFVIGFVWACCVNVLLLVVLKVERGVAEEDLPLWIWLFIKNWMFCTVNAILFDIKDYPSDANRHLRTFVVRFGLRRTIFYILIPLLLIGLLSLFVFAWFRAFSPLQVLFNVLPFIATIAVAYSMHKRQPILYYLMVIDGLILFKALCGILGMQFSGA
ncbi:hypothetical protein C7T94_04920 [Pedobacter yulinensis]|uniref:UbiA prenyltransferase family protein n=1 Tax=Pedobacter yulinensis TaxID=2126353 RepID=A0A2T3HNW7_9SPHI|nr:hypothetical protein [Pedobacter yulinensis]PST84081.1 hypothetical protein C7T94_04920 [Pedobacter yulinensis]